MTGPDRNGLPGVLVAGLTALISGLSVFVNSYGVHSLPDPAVYTTAKNLVASIVLGGCALGAWWGRSRWPESVSTRFVSVTHQARSGHPDPPASGAATVWRLIGMAYVGIVGGGIAFVLFFDGLADTTAAPAAFWRDTLVVWVALLAVPILRERLAWWNVAAIVFLVAGEVVLARGVGHLAPSRGELLVLCSSALWGVEVVVAKVLLRDVAPAAMGVIRMGIGSVTLVVYLAGSGALHALTALDVRQSGWVLLTGLLLAAYVGTWMTALARARAVDVTSVLVGSALVTALLQAVAGTAVVSPPVLGLVLVGVGCGLVLWMGLRRTDLRSVVPVVE